MYLVYKCDVWHTHQSKELIAVCEDMNFVHNAISEQAKNEGEQINDDDMLLIELCKQTQSYDGEGEFLIEEIEINKLI